MKKPKAVISFAPTTNAKGKKDVTGAFAPEQRLFSKAMKAVGASTKELSFDNTVGPTKRAAEVLKHLDSGPFDVVAFLCHGWLDGMQAGFGNGNVKRLAKALQAASPKDVTVVLYCCSTGKDPQDDPLSAVGTGDDSFADRLRDSLCELGHSDGRVVAHTTAAHTTRNPHVIFFEGMGSPVGGIGGIAPVLPGRELWKPWRTALRTTDLRFRFPLMDVGEIHAELLEA